MYKVGGYIPLNTNINCSHFDDKKTAFAKLAAANNATRYIIPEFTPISDQLSIGSCVGNACADSLEILKGLEDPNKITQVSRMFLYFNARNAINTTDKDEGCLISDAMASMKTLGVCPENTWPYDISKVFTKPTLEAYREGDDNTLSDFYQILTTGEARQKDIETAVRANHPVVFGTQVGSDFLNYNGENIVFDPPKTSIGGHALIITGIRYNSLNKREFYIRNSWGASWGMSEPETAFLGKGHCWFSSKYIDNITMGDIFVPTRMKDFLL